MTTRFFSLAFMILTCMLSSTGTIVANAAMVTFAPFLDSNTEPNTSATTPYASDTNQTNAPAGIPDNMLAIYSDTFFYQDADTGIKFNFDVEWSATGGNLNGSTTTLGVGAENNVGAGESLSVALSNLQIDFSEYISGSVDSITTPTLDDATLSFFSIGFADRTDNTADESIVDIAGSSTVSWGTAAGGVDDNTFNFGADGLTTEETSILLTQNDASTVDDDFSLAFTRLNVEVNLSQASAVPEPSAIFPFAMLLMSVYPSRRR